MANQLLDTQSINELRLSSQLSGTPIGASYQTSTGQPVQLVALDKWVVTKDLFVTIWFWYMLGSKVYNGQVDRDSATNTIRSLNTEEILRLSKPNWDLLDQVYTSTTRAYQDQKLSIEAKRNILARVLEEVAASTRVELEAA